MNNVAIRAEGIGKEYRLGERSKGYQTLRDTLVEAAGWPRRLLARDAKLARQARHETIWALRDVSFEIQSGEILGIIGHNGSGKSTLLKILSRITEPTEGEARIHGRVGSLLEVGTGFHPELTGRENTYLNGAILGMKRTEINRKFDEIVAFAEVEKFVDTPVKHYSSGMYLRLAFAVAAHLEPEILLVDEVLAVGDVMFQKKCIAKMGDVARQGSTVLLVSHNLALVKEYCRSGILLRHGRIVEQGPMVECIGKYSKQLSATQDIRSFGSSSWTNVRLRSASSESGEGVAGNEPVTAEASLVLTSDMRWGKLFCHFDSSSGEHIVQTDCRVTEEDGGLQRGVHKIAVEIPPLWLAPDAYTCYFKFLGATDTGEPARFLSEVLLLNIVDELEETPGKARVLAPGKWRIAGG